MSVTELYFDDPSAQRYARLANQLNYAVRAGETYEEIQERCDRLAGDAEKRQRPGMPESDRDKITNLVQDWLDIKTMAGERIALREEGVEQGHQVSNRLAAQRQRRRDMIEASHDISQAIKDQGIKIGPSFDELQQKRYGRKITKRERGRDGL